MVLINFSRITDFPSLCIEYISIAFFLAMISLIYCKIHCLYLPYTLFGLQLGLSNTFWKALKIVIPFLSFKGITHAYLLKISITHNKRRIPISNLLINCISATSAQQILCIKDEYTFLFSNFLKIGLCNSSANPLLDIISFLITPPEVSLSKN